MIGHIRCSAVILALATLLPSCSPQASSPPTPLPTSPPNTPTARLRDTLTPEPTATAASTDSSPLFIGSPLDIPLEPFTVKVDNLLVSIDIPSGMEGQITPGKNGEFLVSFPGEDLDIQMYFGNLAKTHVGELDLDEYVDYLLRTFARDIPNFELASRTTRTSPDGFPFELLIWKGWKENVIAITMIYVHNRTTAAMITYHVDEVLATVFADTVGESFDTFRVDAE